jgi:hypothetical protein
MLQTTPELTLECRPRHRFLEPIHNVKDGALRSAAASLPRIWFLHSWKDGGASRDRTGDLKLAKLALSQLSYGPDPGLAGARRRHPEASRGEPISMVGLGRFELPTSRLSSARSNQLSYRPKRRLRSSEERETKTAVSRVDLVRSAPKSCLDIPKRAMGTGRNRTSHGSSLERR